MGMERTGSFALAKEKKNLLAASLEAHADNILNVINKIAIPKLIKLNTFTGYTEYPKIIRGEIETPDMVKLADSMERFMNIGMPFFPNEKTEDYIKQCLGLPVLSEEEKKKLKDTGTEPSNNGDDKLKPRQYAEHQTDDKEEFNDTYEEAGMKKIWKQIKSLFNKEGDRK